MILELKQFNDSKNLESTCTDHPRIKRLQPHSVSIFPLILSFHPSIILFATLFQSVSLSAYSILIDSVFHSRWLPYVLFLLAHTTAFHQSTSSCQKRTILYSWLQVDPSFSLSAWPLVCYRSIQLLPQSFWLHWACHIYCRHYIYYGFCCSVCLSVSIVISLL